MKRLVSLTELAGSLIGFLWLFGPPAWQEVGRGVTIALLVVLGIAGGSGVALIYIVVRSQVQPPYTWKV
jgi:hypothetical protein